MTKIEIEQGIVQYLFEPLKGRHFGTNILVLINQNEAILIDTAYEGQALQVFQDLNNSGIKIKKIILTHFHDDHMRGLKVLPKVFTYGSYNFKITLNMWTKKEEHKDFTPKILIDKSTVVNFGKYELGLIPFQGHSACGILIKINNKYIHIGDELMFSNDGKPILPTADGNDIKRHICSLNKLRDYSDYALIPGHGIMISGKERIEKEISNRISYFNAILNSCKKLTYEEAVTECECSFLHKEWHEYIYE
jgi:glyoxylase-like metal-dependent hydrolase (beta-lactamase superfamily II)